jgi:hypothetical protein
VTVVCRLAAVQDNHIGSNQHRKQMGYITEYEAKGEFGRLQNAEYIEDQVHKLTHRGTMLQHSV